MSLVILRNAALAYGLHPLLDGANLVVAEGERIGLIGRNGTGKSSLLLVLAGQRELDDGEFGKRDGLRTVLVEQEPVLPPGATLRESLVQRMGLDAQGDEARRWQAESRLTSFLDRFGLDAAADPGACSGGETKRAALAAAFALEPELLLLDEPTNHLDIDAIADLEALVAKQKSAIVITHDRAFLDRVATRIVELDRGLLRSYPGNYAAWQERRSVELAAEETIRRKFDRFWAQEEAWIRKGVEARRTRNEGRVRRLEALREARMQRRDRIGNVRMALDAGERSGKLVAELEHVGKRFGDRVIVRDLSTRIMRGDRVGFIGRNGAGKTTLLKLILGDLEPDQGNIRRGTGLAVAYFDQLRAVLDPARTLVDTISPGSEWIEADGRRRHVLSYLGDFLFPPERANAPVSTLSGGERNRLLLARLFAQPANLLVLDEPTNDLDIESLELLEATLQGYGGTLLLVSHDRAFLDNVVTQTLVAEGDGRWQAYAGGYTDWLSQRSASPAAADNARSNVTARPAAAEPARSRVGLGFKETRELAALPAEIEALEAEQHALTERMSHADYHKQGGTAIRADRERAVLIEQDLAAKLDRWVELDARAEEGQRKG